MAEEFESDQKDWEAKQSKDKNLDRQRMFDAIKTYNESSPVADSPCIAISQTDLKQVIFTYLAPRAYKDRDLAYNQYLSNTMNPLQWDKRVSVRGLDCSCGVYHEYMEVEYVEKRLINKDPDKEEICPECYSEAIEQTTRGCLMGKNTNRATCLDCDWRGEVWQLRNHQGNKNKDVMPNWDNGKIIEYKTRIKDPIVFC